MHVTSHDLRHWLCTDTPPTLCARVAPAWLATVEDDASRQYNTLQAAAHESPLYWEAHDTLAGIKLVMAAQGYEAIYHEHSITFALLAR
jgi:hypothetical protein